MNWLEQTRQALRAKKINLSGRFQPSETEAYSIETILNDSQTQIADLLKDENEKRAAKLETAFQKGLERGMIRTIKGVRRGINKGCVNKVDTSSTKNLELIANEYRTAVDFVLSLSKLGTSTFSRAATITPYWNGKEPQEVLSTPKIITHLQKQGVEMTEKEVEDVFTKSVRMRFAVKNISDPLEACQRYLRAEVSYGGKYYKGSH